MAVCNMLKFLNMYTGEQMSASLSVCSCAKSRHTIPLERGLFDCLEPGLLYFYVNNSLSLAWL
jgi:hypothetical protein